MASILSIFIVVVITSGFTTNPLSGQAEGCGGMIEADNGTLQLEPSHRLCLWLITLTNTTGIRLELSPLMLFPILVTPYQNVDDQNLKSVWISGSKGVFYNFQAKSLTIMTPHFRTEKSNLSWTGLAADISGVSFNTKFVNESKGTMAWKHERAERNEIFWVLHQRTGGHISWNLDTQLPACYMVDPCQSVYFVVLEFKANGTIWEIKKTCEGSSKLSMMVAKGSQVLIILHINAPVEATTRLYVTWKYDEHVIQGLIVGAYLSGISVIAFNSIQAHIANSKDVLGLAFDWNSSQIYWLQERAGIRRANLNESVTEALLIQDDSNLRGLAIDPVSENLYFGNRSSKTIRVCNKNASKCSTIAKNSDSVSDLAVHWSKGFLFWSNYRHQKSIDRTNLDGSNRKVLLNKYGVRGISIDEEEDRLYWSHENGIESSNLDLREIRPLTNVHNETMDVAIYGENVYYAPHRKDLPRNPCEKSKCSHLCVRISLSSYRCLCPDGEKVASDGTTCTA